MAVWARKDSPGPVEEQHSEGRLMERPSVVHFIPCFFSHLLIKQPQRASALSFSCVKVRHIPRVLHICAGDSCLLIRELTHTHTQSCMEVRVRSARSLKQGSSNPPVKTKLSRIILSKVILLCMCVSSEISLGEGRRITALKPDTLTPRFISLTHH